MSKCTEFSNLFSLFVHTIHTGIDSTLKATREHSVPLEEATQTKSRGGEAADDSGLQERPAVVCVRTYYSP